MKSSEILRNAARLVESGRATFGCVAVDVACGWSFSLANRACGYVQLFRPPLLDKYGGYWSMKDVGPRIIGLCLAAAIAESEGD